MCCQLFSLYDLVFTVAPFSITNPCVFLFFVIVSPQMGLSVECSMVVFFSCLLFSKLQPGRDRELEASLTSAASQKERGNLKHRATLFSLELNLQGLSHRCEIPSCCKLNSTWSEQHVTVTFVDWIYQVNFCLKLGGRGVQGDCYLNSC